MKYADLWIWIVIRNVASCIIFSIGSKVRSFTAYYTLRYSWIWAVPLNVLEPKMNILQLSLDASIWRFSMSEIFKDVLVNNPDVTKRDLKTRVNSKQLFLL